MAALLIAACAGASKPGDTASGCKGATMTMANGEVMCASAMDSGGSGHSASRLSATAGKTTSGMNVGSGGSTKVPEVDGVAPVATQVLATRYWQGMEIQAQTRTPVRFILFNGAKEQVVDPPEHASFHLMVMLSDARTGEPMPYSGSVWATITNSKGKSPYSSQQWPMISAYMGPHYGDNVPHLASGRYKLTVLIGPPTSARASEYRDVWLKPHDVTMLFRWNAKTASATVIGRSGTASPAGSMSDMTGMSSMAVHTNVPVNGVRSTPSRLIATAYWQGMRVQTRSAAPTPFYISDASGIKTVEPAAGSSFYMMVMLNDQHTGEAVTYAPVAATIKNAADKVVYHGRMEPTISAFKGPYYGNNVKLPGVGRYTLTLRIDPPHQARHLEYQHVWLQPHTVVEHFTWSGDR
jgi:uncharacterized protein involved in high-affinity Fe2+ transport